MIFKKTKIFKKAKNLLPFWFLKHEQN